VCIYIYISRNPTFVPNKLAVVCIDPSSTITGGSILGDKTRMTDLSRHENAYVRPSPSKGVLGGVSNYTNDVVNLCQAAGYDLILVESVGIGQSEVDISQGVEMLILMVAPGGGDGLQGVKKGIVEVADMLVVNKADGNLLPAAQSTAAAYKGATHLFRIRRKGWETIPVLLASAESRTGLGKVWDQICKFKNLVERDDELKRNRARQSRYWMWKRVQDLITAKTQSDPVLREKARDMEHGLDRGNVAPRAAAWEILETIKGGSNE
jgi:LAO/AO transport system kinase